MSLYFRVYTSFFYHRKTLRLRQAIGDAAFWVPPRLWAYAVEHQPDGNFGKFSDQEIAAAIGYPEDAAQLIEAMTSAGFLDGRRRIKNWAEHNAYHAAFKERARRAAQCRWEKEKRQDKDRTGQDREKKPRRKDNDKKRKEQALRKHAQALLEASEEDALCGAVLFPRLQKSEPEALQTILDIASDGNPAEMTTDAKHDAAKWLWQIANASPTLNGKSLADEIRIRAKNFEFTYPTARLTPRALCKHWAAIRTEYVYTKDPAGVARMSDVKPR